MAAGGVVAKRRAQHACRFRSYWREAFGAIWRSESAVGGGSFRVARDTSQNGTSRAFAHFCGSREIQRSRRDHVA